MFEKVVMKNNSEKYIFITLNYLVIIKLSCKINLLYLALPWTEGVRWMPHLLLRMRRLLSDMCH